MDKINGIACLILSNLFASLHSDMLTWDLCIITVSTRDNGSIQQKKEMKHMVSCHATYYNSLSAVYVCRHTEIYVPSCGGNLHIHSWLRFDQKYTFGTVFFLALFNLARVWLNSMGKWNENNLSTRAHNTTAHMKTCNQDYCYLFWICFHLTHWCAFLSLSFSRVLMLFSLFQSILVARNVL